MSADIDRNDVLTAMRGIDLYKDVPENAIKLERLGGLTNRNYRIDSPRGRHVLRIPGAGTSEYISRKNEASRRPLRRQGWRQCRRGAFRRNHRRDAVPLRRRRRHHECRAVQGSWLGEALRDRAEACA
jgi:hypothetical protein